MNNVLRNRSTKYLNDLMNECYEYTMNNVLGIRSAKYLIDLRK